jgi:hypothetical protein
LSDLFFSRKTREIKDESEDSQISGWRKKNTENAKI